MTGFLAKLRVVTLGTAHDLLDKKIDMNSPSALRQYVRDLEDALDKMRNEAATQAGVVRTLTREIGDLQHRIESETAVVAKIVAHADPTTNTIARAKAASIVNWKNELASKQQTLETQTATSRQIDNAVDKLNAKHTVMVQQVRELERVDTDTKLKEQAAASLQQAGKLVSNGSDISVDDIKSKMLARNDVASEKLDRAMGAVEVEDDSENSAAVDDLLASLQQPQGK